MSDPPRILGKTREGGGDPNVALRRALLRAGRGDAPPPEAKRQLLNALGLGDDAVSAAGAPVSGVRRAKASDWQDRAPLFASARDRGGAFYRRLGAPALVSMAVHAAVLALVLYGSARAPSSSSARDPEVTLRVHPPTVAGATTVGAPRAEVELPRGPEAAQKPAGLVASRAREGKPAAPDRAPGEPAVITPIGASSHLSEGAPTGVAGGVVGGAVGGIGAAPPPAPPSEEVLSFGEGMNRPQRIDGPEPVYPREAREAKVEGTMLVKCVITTTGSLQRCQILKSLPFLDQPVLAALASQHYTPVTFQGRPVNVEYVIPLKFELP